MFAQWWIWVVAGLLLAIAEVLLPTQIFAGLAVGALLTGGWIGLGFPGGDWLAADPVNGFLAFGVLSLVAWLVLRRVMGIQRGQVRRFDHDIND